MKITVTNLNQSVIRLIPVSIIFLSLIGITESIPHEASSQSSTSSSPSFAHQEIVDGYEILFDTKTQNPVDDDDTINILSVDYLSNGKYFNATLWLAYPISKFINPDAKNRMYGMLIDADLNNQTGVQGSDYRSMLEWRNRTKTWERVFEQLATPSSNVTSNVPSTRLLEIDSNYTDGLFNRQGRQNFRQNFVELSADLERMGYPERFRVTFFAQDRGSSKGSEIADFTNWVSIPQPEMTISISPNPLVLRQGGQNTTEVQIESSAGYNTRVRLNNFTDQSSGIKLIFADNELILPSHGVALTQLEVMAPSGVKLFQHSIPIEAVLTIPPRSIFESQSAEGIEDEEQENMGTATPIPSATTSSRINQTQNQEVTPNVIPAALTNQTQNQEVHQNEILSVIVEPPPQLPDPITSFINWLTPIAGLVATLLGVAASAAAGIIGIMKYYERKDKKGKTNQEK